VAVATSGSSPGLQKQPSDATGGRVAAVGLAHAFYRRPVVEVAQALIGCVVTHGPCSGVIVETEAYHDSEPAAHSYTGMTDRTRTLFGPPGHAYVYLSYGVHEPLNAVCEDEGVGAAVLIRALEPLTGIEQMAERRGLRVVTEPGEAGSGFSARELRALCSGPGKLTQALAITRRHNGVDLATGPVLISARPDGWKHPRIVASRRIGITKAVELPWRFCAADSRYLSRPA
jgi:DNA-3-methyladenine glycosylase